MNRPAILPAILRATLAVLLLAAPLPSAAAGSVPEAAGPKALLAALKSAAAGTGTESGAGAESGAEIGGGTVVRLAPGVHGALRLSGLRFARPVTVLAHGATTGGLWLTGVSNLTIEGLTVAGTPEKPASIVARIKNARDVTLRGVTVRGGPDANGNPTGKGLVVLGSERVTVEDSVFENAKIGVQFIRSSEVRFAGNTVRAMSGDGLNLVMTQDAAVEGNVFRDFVVTKDGHHPDMLQVWTLKNTPPDRVVRDIAIRGNVFDQGRGSWTQTMLIQGRRGDLRLRNVVIENNLIHNSHTHGITVNNTVGLAIRNNTLIEQTAGLTRYQPPRINVFKSEDVVIDRNIAPDVKTDGRARGRNLTGRPQQLRRMFDDRLRPIGPVEAGASLTLDSPPRR